MGDPRLLPSRFPRRCPALAGLPLRLCSLRRTRAPYTLELLPEPSYSSSTFLVRVCGLKSFRDPDRWDARARQGSHRLCGFLVSVWHSLASLEVILKVTQEVGVRPRETQRTGWMFPVLSPVLLALGPRSHHRL